MKFFAVDDGEIDLLALEKELEKTFPREGIVGYLIKPVTADEMKASEKPMGSMTGKEKKVYIRTFGNFDVFVDNKIVEFNHSKAKELLAYLVDRRGSCVTTPEAYSMLWEDCDYTSATKDKIQHAKKDLRDILRSFGIEDILISRRNMLALDTEKVHCDYYDYLEGDNKSKNYYTGEYMTQYSWAEDTLGALENLRWS